MRFAVRALIYMAMVLLAIASMWTTYVSLHDSILPEPVLPIPIAALGITWKCSVIALSLSLAIGIMLFALKIAIIDGQKRLNIFGLAGMTIIAFISIAFNLDVLYRTADRDFFLRYSNDHMRSTYEHYLSDVNSALSKKRTELNGMIAKQEGELDAEVKGLRKAPAGYGQYAKEEDYKLTLLQRTAQVEIQAVDEAIATKQKADELLSKDSPTSIEEVDKLQGDLRVVCKDLAAVSGIQMPEFIKLESPLFAVFAKIFDTKSFGWKEALLIIIAFFMDLGDIIGYTLIPNHKKSKEVLPPFFEAPALNGPPRFTTPVLMDQTEEPPMLEPSDPSDEAISAGQRANRFRLRR